jgi:hypothetical protein
MKRLVIVGASGMVGGYALRYALEHPRAIYPAFRVVFPGLVTRSDVLARAMVDVSVRETGERENRVFENRDILAMANSAQTHHPTSRVP